MVFATRIELELKRWIASFHSRSFLVANTLLVCLSEDRLPSSQMICVKVDNLSIHKRSGGKKSRPPSFPPLYHS
eukprot:gene26717-biopygen4715